LFQNRQVTEILAQPKLVMKNGRAGGFLAGGEIPIPFATEDDITIEFKPFGVRLDFVPTITWSNTIDLRIFPEVSEVDPSVSVTFAGVTIPGFRVRRSVNRVEMKEGEALIISGLLDKRIFKDLQKFPFLGDLPVLGALFRTTRFRNQETELVFVVTPQIVKPLQPGVSPPIPSIQKYRDPDMRQTPLPVPPPPPPAAPQSTVPYGSGPAARAAQPAMPSAAPTPRDAKPDVRQVPSSMAESPLTEPAKSAQPTMP
jgi:pilus assembly protein CpaC